MNQTRSFLLIAWLVVATLLWMEWNKAPSPEAGTVASAPVATALPGPSTPAMLPGAAAPLPSAPAMPGAPASSPASTASDPVTIANDRLRLTVDLHGGRVIDSQLLQYTEEKKPGSPNVRLLTSDPAKYYVADAGLITVDALNAQHEMQAQFHTANGARAAELAPGAADVALPMEFTDPATGLTVHRTLSMKRGSYVLQVTDQVSNAGSTAQRVYPFMRLSRLAPPPPPKHSFMTNPESLSFVGAAWHSPDENYQKTKWTDFGVKQPSSTADVAGVWFAMLQHHFVTAWVPMPEEKQILRTSVSSHEGVPLYELRSIATPMQIAPAASATHQGRLWVGPKLQAPLAQLAPSLDLSVDYGKLSVIARPLFWLLSKLHQLFGNWGWAIIAIVVLLKAALYPLSAKQYKSMARIRAVQPRIEKLKELHGEDKQAFQIAMMDLYKKEKINPIGGCLPMLIPIPIFLGLYWVLLETVELRHAPWMGWIQNLTAADPYFILPALNLIVMYLTQKLTPMPGMDPLQKKMMQFMPLVFGVMMAFFPAGLVLYWVTNGLLGLLQQWWMTKQHGPKTAVVAR
jgi:YidC/Oxa1 family membrane protein insertase